MAKYFARKNMCALRYRRGLQGFDSWDRAAQQRHEEKLRNRREERRGKERTKCGM